MLRQLCVERRRSLEAREFEDAIAACNLLPDHQLAIFCAWRVSGRAGAVVGGACFILPGLILILALGALPRRLAPHPGCARPARELAPRRSTAADLA